MGILIGMDEAGYGPNLGPLVVAATAWEVRSQQPGARSKNSPRGHRGERHGRDVVVGQGLDGSSQTATASPPRSERTATDLYELLGALVSRAPTAGRLAIADSKALYRPGLGLSTLEHGVHAALTALDRPAASWSAVVETLTADPYGLRRCLPWHADFDCPLPVDAAADELATLGARLAEACAASGVQPLALRARLVFSAEFNELVEHHGSKGAALSHVTIGLLQELLGTLLAKAAACKSVSLTPDPSPPTPTLVVCDKHGGRNRYAGLLQHFFPSQWIETLVESRAESRYHWGAADGRVEVAFRRGGEAFLPAALASMTAKYLRELSMRAFNEFWCAHVPDLRPTAGYPTDARRFKADIAHAQQALGIDDHILWRNR